MKATPLHYQTRRTNHHRRHHSPPHLSPPLRFTLHFLLPLNSLLTTKTPAPTTITTVVGGGASLPEPIFDALLHYTSISNSTDANRLSSVELKSVAAVLRHCNLLVFGLTHETPLWHALNRGGGDRIVLVNESAYLVSIKWKPPQPQI